MTIGSTEAPQQVERPNAVCDFCSSWWNNCWLVHSLSNHMTACILPPLDLCGCQCFSRSQKSLGEGDIIARGICGEKGKEKKRPKL